jgi:hypothetical protein
MSKKEREQVLKKRINFANSNIENELHLLPVNEKVKEKKIIKEKKVKLNPDLELLK